MERRIGLLASTQGGVFDINNYLTIVALEDGLTASLSTNDVEYCIDGDENWTTLTAGTASPVINTGQTLSFRGNLTPVSRKGIGTFTISKSCDLTGNCNSLLFGNNAKTNLSLGKSYAFYELFNNCNTIKSISPNFLPATTLANYCYYSMFSHCRSLIAAPELPATTLADYCYQEMFFDCTSLTTAPELPATTLADYCYDSMFKSCSSLTTPPELPATKLKLLCYDSMFMYCRSLTTAPELPATSLAQNCYYMMFYDTNVLPDCSNIDFSSSTVVNSSGIRGLFAGTKVTDEDLMNILPINSNGKYYLPVITLQGHCYSHMFYNCTSLTTPPELPATTLANYCYESMFYNCTSLTTPPELPATTLANYCYRNMFYGCSSLITTPELPATELQESCYSSMFSNCISLIIPPELPATTLADKCYESMFLYCTSLTTAPELPATTLAYRCYYEMFWNCASLTTAPELPAKTLVSECYNNMFYGCSSLNYIKALFTTKPSGFYTSNWVSRVASSGTFVKNIDATWDVTNASGIPPGWTVVYAWSPQTCINLSILADNVENGNQSTTTIHYTALCEGVDEDGIVSQRTLTGDEEIEIGQNKTTASVQKTVSFTYLNKTATTTITQGPWVDSFYTVNLNDQWQKSSTISNPNSSTYDGVYESYSNKGTNNSGASMYIDINGYTNFKLYIRSYAESNYDYVMVSQLDKTLTYNSSYSDTTLVKAHTRGNQKSGTTINDYTLVEFTNIPSGTHRIQIIYRKDSSSHSGDDRGYVLIPRNQ